MWKKLESFLHSFSQMTIEWWYPIQLRLNIKIHSHAFLVISFYNEARIMCNTYFISTSVIITTCNRLSYTNIIIESVKHNVQWSIVLYAVQNRQFQRKQLHGWWSRNKPNNKGNCFIRSLKSKTFLVKYKSCS